MIHYVLGRTSSGKSRWMHLDIEKKLNQEKLLLIVPEQYTLQAEIELIHDLESQGIMAVEVMSFNRLCHKIIEETGDMASVEINSLGKAMVLRSILDKHFEELEVFKSISKKAGFVEKLSTLISEMKRVGIDYEQLKKQVDKDNKNLVEKKLSDIALILEYYNLFMDKGYFDEEDKLKMVLSRLDQSELVRNAVIYIDGFDSFSNQEYQLIEKLACLSKNIYVALTIDIQVGENKEQLFAPVVKTFKKLRKIAETHKIEEKKTMLQRPLSHKDLAVVEQEFFSYPYEVFDESPERVEVHLCNNFYEEIEMVAEKIVKNIRYDHIRYSDIAIVTGGLETYSSIIKRVFNEYEIPYFIDDKVGIMTHPIVQYILASLAALNSGFKYEDVFRLIKTELTNVKKRDIYRLENYVLAYGVRGSKWSKEFYDESLEAARLEFIEPLLALKSKLKTKGQISSYVKIIYNYLIEQKIPEKIEKWNIEFRNNHILDKAQETTQIWNQMIDIFDQLVELEGDDTKTIKEFMRILEAGFTEVKLGLIPPSLDQVIIGSIERSKSKTVKHMYVIGVNDGVMPKKYSDEGIILEDEKQYLKSKGIDLETDSGSIMAKDQFATYVAFSKTSEHLCISYALSDYEGKALRPSLYIDKFKRLFSKLSVVSHLSDDLDPLKAFTPSNHYKKMTTMLRRYADEQSIDEKWFNVLYWYHNNPVWTDRVQRLTEAIYYDNQVQSISKTQARKLFDLPLKASVSRLERYAKCPYSHFVHYGLSPKKRQEYELKLPDIGLLFHNTLERFDDVMKTENRDWKTIQMSEVFEIVEVIVDELVTDFGFNIFESSHRYKYLIKKLKRVGKRAVWTMVQQIKQGEFRPYAHEIAFSLSGEQFTVPPIIIEMTNGETILLEGRIDRIDLYEQDGKQYVKVIDYKSGSKKFNLSEVYQGLQLQLMVYLDAILENSDYFRQDKLYPAGVFYFKIDDPMLESEVVGGDLAEEEIAKLLKMDGLMLKDVSVARAMDSNLIEQRKSNIIPVELKKDESMSSRSKVADEVEFMALIDHLKETIATLGTAIGDGVTKIEPFKLGLTNGCQTCDYKSICQFDTAFDNQYNYLKNMKDEEVLEAVVRKDELNAKLDN